VTHVKICGVKRVEDALVAAEAGADFIGLMFFTRSPRRIGPETAAEIAEAVRGKAKTVGVFVNADPEEMNLAARTCRLDYVQLSGSEGPETVRALEVPAIDVIHVREDLTPEDLAERVARSPAEVVLLDTARDGIFGGTGQTFDWSRVSSLSRPIMLAGGLHPDNVADAIRTVRPWGVDVSSGVELNGEKDHGRIRAFIAAAREA
jgi:phosphoribosylanthranilate isomerase